MLDRFTDIVTNVYSKFPNTRRSNLSIFKNLLAQLGNPQHRMPPAIHIVGTNGKGSTQAFLKSCLTTAGYRIHAYTSPHLLHFNERITIAGDAITSEQFLHYYDRIISLPEAEHVTWFELITAIAFMAYADHPADIAIIEAGLGGRLDATNVLSTVIATVVTSISLDHQQQLGTTLAAISQEKAAVMRARVPVITCQQQAEVMNGLQYQAQLQNSFLYLQNNSWHCSTQDDHLCFKNHNGHSTHALPNLIGRHQIQNAGLALATLDIIKDRLPCSAHAIDQGLAHCHWPGRLQRIKPSFTNPVLQQHSIYVDCAHNQGGIQALVNFIQQQRIRPLMIMGVLKRRGLLDLIQPLQGHVAGMIGISIDGEDSHDGQDVAECAGSYNIPNAIAKSYKDALDMAVSWSQPFTDIIICGSIYLIGDILRRQ